MFPRWLFELISSIPGPFIRHFPNYDFVYIWSHGPQKEHVDANVPCELVLIQDLTVEYSQIEEKLVFTSQPSS